ncbi:hypothetical protein PtB15_17B125 [Puccinia triticina]|nr:hypothetical protein PtB15_17B125 [Puccinia triticina]
MSAGYICPPASQQEQSQQSWTGKPAPRPAKICPQTPSCPPSGPSPSPHSILSSLSQDDPNDINPTHPLPSHLSSLPGAGPILPNQRWLALDIAELVCLSSLPHDIVIDQAERRSGQPSLLRESGSKLAVLAGNFMLARASISLSRLANLYWAVMTSTLRAITSSIALFWSLAF